MVLPLCIRMKQPPTAPPTALHLSWAERLESLKAAIVGAIAAACGLGLLIAFNSLVLVPRLPAASGVPTWALGPDLWLNVGIAQFSGALFAITYRYIIRHDANSHLRSGAVGAFGLVRGLAQVELGWHTALQWPALVAFVVESFMVFGGVQWILDWAIAHHWLQPFPSPRNS